MKSDPTAPRSSKKATSFGKFQIWLLALGLAGLLTAGGVYNQSYLKEGFQVLRSQGAMAALTFFQSKGESNDNVFGTAWAAYRHGDYRQAEELCKQLLRSPGLNDQARANYLIGELNTIGGDFETAREHLLTALAIYETMGKTESQFKSQMALAKLHLSQKDLANASYYLNLAQTREGAWQNPYFLYLQSQLEFLRGNMASALSLALEREKHMGDDLSGYAGVYSDIGFYYGLTGELDLCAAYTAKAQAFAEEQDDLSASMHNAINQCLYLKLNDRPFDHLREAIVAFAHETNDTKLMDAMVFVDRYTVPSASDDVLYSASNTLTDGEEVAAPPHSATTPKALADHFK